MIEQSDYLDSDLHREASCDPSPQQGAVTRGGTKVISSSGNFVSTRCSNELKYIGKHVL